MTLVHVVILKFTPTTPYYIIKRALDDAGALKDQCLHPTTNKPYVRSFKAGKDNSKENLQKGYSHLFVMEFENTDDRDYYVSKDPAHQDYVKMLTTGEFPVKEVQVLDFTEGDFTESHY